jgi:hypothetical protein
MKVHGFDWDGVNGGFGLTEQLKGAGGTAFYGVGEGRGADDGEDRGKGTMVLVIVRMFMRMSVLGRWLMLMGMQMAVGVFMRMGCGGIVRMIAMFVAMFMSMLDLMAGGGRNGRSFCREHIDLGGGQTAANDFAGLKAGANIEGCARFLEQTQRDACIDQGTEQHVAADTGKTLQICNSHRG